MNVTRLRWILIVFCLAGTSCFSQKIYHYEISSERRSSGYVAVEYGRLSDTNIDKVKICAYSEFGPCKNYVVIISCAMDTLTGKTDSLGCFYLNRDWHYPWNSIVVNIKIQPTYTNDPNGSRVLPLEQRIRLFSIQESNEVPIRITAMLEPRNIYSIHIRSRKPLNNTQIEVIRDSVIRNLGRRPRIKGIEYEVVSDL